MIFKNGMARIFDFNGRSGRVEYILVVIVICLVTSIFSSLEVYTNPLDKNKLVNYTIIIFYIVLFSCFLAATVRRLHDQDRPWYLMLVYLVPFVGGVVFLLVVFTPGTVGENSYGPDPRGRDNLDSTY